MHSRMRAWILVQCVCALNCSFDSLKWRMEPRAKNHTSLRSSSFQSSSLSPSLLLTSLSLRVVPPRSHCTALHRPCSEAVQWAMIFIFYSFSMINYRRLKNPHRLFLSFTRDDPQQQQQSMSEKKRKCCALREHTKTLMAFLAWCSRHLHLFFFSFIEFDKKQMELNKEMGFF